MTAAATAAASLSAAPPTWPDKLGQIRRLLADPALKDYAELVTTVFQGNRFPETLKPLIAHYLSPEGMMLADALTPGGGTFALSYLQTVPSVQTAIARYIGLPRETEEEACWALYQFRAFTERLFAREELPRPLESIFEPSLPLIEARNLERYFRNNICFWIPNNGTIPTSSLPVTIKNWEGLSRITFQNAETITAWLSVKSNVTLLQSVTCIEHGHLNPYRPPLTLLPQSLFGCLSNVVEMNLKDHLLHTLQGLNLLPRLQRLILNRNHMEVFPGHYLVGLRELNQLHLAENGLRTLPGISALTSLTALELYDNHLDGEAVQGIFSLVGLTFLDLGRNQLATLDGIRRLTLLQTLNLQFNQFESVPEGISSLTNLRYLYLEFNLLRTLPPNLKKYLPYLMELRLQGNFLTQFELTRLRLDCEEEGRFLIRKEDFKQRLQEGFFARVGNSIRKWWLP